MSITPAMRRALDAAERAAWPGLPAGIGDGEARRRVVAAVKAAAPHLREEFAREFVNEEADGTTWVGICPRCFQPVPYGMRCNSGAHEGPDSDPSEAPLAVRSIDLRQAFVHEAVEALRNDMYNEGVLEHTEWGEHFADVLHRHFNPTTEED